MYRQMRYFIAVVETGSFFEAGERCHISQSAVSQQIKTLEEELGVCLLNRSGRKVTLTPSGRYFYEQAKRQTRALESAVQEVRRIEGGKYQRFRVGILHGFSSRILQEAVGRFVKTHPHVHMSLETGTHEELFHAVSNGNLEMVINDQWRALSSQFINEEILIQPLFALVRQDDAPAGEEGIAAESVADRMCILVTSPAQRENEVSHWRDVMGLESSFLFVDSVEEARMNAAAGAGFYPCDEDMPSGSALVQIPLFRDGRRMSRTIYGFWPEGSDCGLQSEFVQMLRESIE